MPIFSARTQSLCLPVPGSHCDTRRLTHSHAIQIPSGCCVGKQLGHGCPSPHFLPCVCSSRGCKRTLPSTKAALKPISTLSKLSGPDHGEGRLIPWPCPFHGHAHCCFLVRYQAAQCLLSDVMRQYIMRNQKQLHAGPSRQH